MARFTLLGHPPGKARLRRRPSWEHAPSTFASLPFQDAQQQADTCALAADQPESLRVIRLRIGVRPDRLRVAGCRAISASAREQIRRLGVAGSRGISRPGAMVMV